MFRLFLMPGHYTKPNFPLPDQIKGLWGEFGKVWPIGCLYSSDNTEEERNKVRGRGSGNRVESIRLDDREKQNEIRIWPKKKKSLSKSLQVNGAFEHPKYAEKSGSDSLTSHLLKKTLPAMHSSLNYLVIRYILKTKNKMHFNLIIVLNHFIAPGIAEPSMMHKKEA
ncbi:hypothetical protein CDL12_15224 [Handroanthus impetiginosus]|uniref:Uncharacterized protein n=1 Tax=Handroanthus impetiginosus TaxID=429701 RepID=A0A2G9H3S3_9LAMI|nr:hypothetical protein CDL12_15224 [Handroanthus impetiginosus]